MYKMRYWFEHGGFCLWASNKKTNEVYGYAIDFRKLPISNSIKEKLNALEETYVSILDWDCPSNPLLWSYKEKMDFVKQATSVLDLLKEELGEDYTIQNDVLSCVYIDENEN